MIEDLRKNVFGTLFCGIFYRDTLLIHQEGGKMFWCEKKLEKNISFSPFFTKFVRKKILWEKQQAWREKTRPYLHLGQQHQPCAVWERRWHAQLRRMVSSSLARPWFSKIAIIFNFKISNFKATNVQIVAGQEQGRTGRDIRDIMGCPWRRTVNGVGL